VLTVLQQRELEILQLTAQVAELRASSSWRLTAPMRWLSVWIKSV
jgi:hypothetical protein